MGNSQSVRRELANTCTTPECIEIANNILSNLSPNYKDLDPCQTWDEYACGGFYDSHKLGPNDDMAGLIIDQANENADLIRQILESPYELYCSEAASPLDKETFSKVQTAWNTCMDTDAILAAGAAPLTKMIEDFTSKVFPLSKDDYANPKNLTEEDYPMMREAYAYLTSRGIPVFYAIYPVAETDTASAYVPAILNVPPTAIAAPDSVLPLYQTLLPSALNESAEMLAAGVIGLETALLDAYPGNLAGLQLREIFNETTFEAASQLAPAIDVTGFLAKTSPVTAEMGKIVWGHIELAALANQILLSTSKPAIQSYFIWQIVYNLLPAVSSPELAKLNPDPAPRYQTCATLLSQQIPFLPSKVFLDKVYPDEVAESLSEIVASLQEGVALDMESLEWATDASKAALKEKITKVAPNVGYSHSRPDNRVAEQVSAFYKDLDVTRTHFGFLANALHFNFDYIVGLFGTKPDREQWVYPVITIGSAATVNALSFRLQNAMYVPYGMAQASQFSPGAPEYVKYGGIGMIIAHEFIHSVDMDGRQTRPDGSLYENGAEDWLDAQTLAAYKERAECIVKQSSAYTVLVAGANGTEELVHQDGASKLNEDLADSGGVNIAYRTWRRRLSQQQQGDGSKNRNMDIPGLAGKFTHDQLFYLANAAPWCALYSAAANATFVGPAAVDVHSIGYARINNMAYNSRGFREAFNCPVKEPTCELF